MDDRFSSIKIRIAKLESQAIVIFNRARRVVCFDWAMKEARKIIRSDRQSGMIGERRDIALNKLATELRKRQKKTRNKTDAASPGSQLPPEMLDKLKTIGVNEFPPAGAKNVQFFGLDGPDVDTRYVCSYDIDGVTKRIYTKKFHENNADEKWARVETLMPQIDGIRSDIIKKLEQSKPGSRQRAAATALAIISVTGLRPGSEKSVNETNHFGVRTLLPEHVSFQGGIANIRFMGKSGKINVAKVTNPVIVGSLKSIHSNTEENDRLFPVSRAMVRKISPIKFKDFRTVKANEVAIKAIEDFAGPPPPLAPGAKGKMQISKVLKQFSRQVAEVLNNTPAMARKSYIMPRIFDDWRKSVSGGSEES